MVARLRGPGFARSVLVLAGGAAGAQLINTLVAPFLTRLYDPTQVGQLGLFLAFVQIAIIALSLRYEQAIVLPTSEAVAARLAALALALVPITSLVAAGILAALIALGIGGYGSLPIVAVPLAVIGLAGYGVVGVLRYWLIRHGAFRAVSQVAIVQSIVRAVSQVVFGLLGAGVVGLLLSDVLGRVLGLGSVIRSAWGTLAAAHAGATVGTRAVAREYWRFPVFGAPSSLLNAAAAALPVPLLAGAYGLPIAGQFALVQRVLGLPLSVIGTSVGDAMLGRMSEQARSDPAAALPLFRRIAIVLAAIGVPGALVLALIGPDLFAFVFGEPWRDAGTIAALMAPWLVAAMIVSPLSRVALVYQGQGQKFIYDLLSLGAVAGSILGGAAAGLNAFEAIGLLAWLQAVAYGVYLVVLYRLVVAGSARLPRA